MIISEYIKDMRIILSRHGESVYNTENRIGGDPVLSDMGVKYAQKLSEFIGNTEWFPRKCICSTRKRVEQTVDAIKDKMDTIVLTNELDELNAGICENLTYTQFYQIYMDEFTNRYADKLNYRYPGGESYDDLIERVRSVADDVKRQNSDVLIVSHQAVSRALLHHFIGVDIEEVPHLDVPLNTLIVIKDGKKITEISL